MTEHEAETFSNTPNSIQIVETIAEQDGRDPTEVDFTLNDHVDPDALNSLLETGSEGLVVTFTIDDKVVTVAKDGTIEITDEE
ncbi:hypothetical protein HYG81_21355 (plasmid) [Natrinema zhouii]|uniref:HalOD1 output domain-containing protein n=1 Tax=Natrinema zhouii TaxID=1710539 RepID=UPI001CFFEF7B|nr:HalOD1 output domain-containing protein [Natrinema zhouii]UHQ98128.1 hypothetical protein HYG81_21355 [Natrinema zhouii]